MGVQERITEVSTSLALGEGVKTENDLLWFQTKAEMGGIGGNLGEGLGMTGQRGPYEEFRLYLDNNGITLEGILVRMN